MRTNITPLYVGKFKVIISHACNKYSEFNCIPIYYMYVCCTIYRYMYSTTFKWFIFDLYV